MEGASERMRMEAKGKQGKRERRAAIILMMAACVLSLFSGNRISSYIPLAFPIFLQEMVLAVWLIVKGFNPSAVASLPAKTATNELLSAA